MRSFFSTKMRMAFGASVGVATTAAAIVYASPVPIQETPFLSPSEFRKLELVDMEQITPDTRRLRLAFPHPHNVSGLEASSCVVVKYTDAEGKDVLRPYTPITDGHQRGYLDLLIKKYPNAKMGTYLHNLKRGQQVEIKGPFEKIKYEPNKWNHIGMIAGGTGITPMYQILKAANANKKDKTKISLIYLCQTEDDFMLGQELANMNYNPNVYVYLSVEKPKKGWVGGVGRLTPEMIKNIMPAPGAKDSLVMICGPPPMMQAVSGDKDYTKYPPGQGSLAGMLKDMGYKQEEIFKF